MDYTVNILIIRFSSIGDIVLTTPVIRALKKQLEGKVKIHFLTKKVYAEILKHNPYIDHLHTIEKSTNEVIEDLQQVGFDYIVDLHKNLRSTRVKRRLKGLYFTFDKLNWKKWLLVNFKIDQMPDIHIVDRYLGAVKALGIENDGQGLDYFIDEANTTPLQLPESFGSYVAFVVGANHATKKLNLEKASELIAQIKKPIVLIGGKEDSSFAENLVSQFPDRLSNACGKTSISQSALLIKNASLVFTPDTGMMHIAAAFQKRIISIWGNTVPAFGMYPYLKEENKSQVSIYEVSGLKCRPCSKIGYEKCPKGHFKCILELPSAEIAEEINQHT